MNVSPVRVTSSGPLRVWNRTDARAGSSCVIRTNAVASVACPHRSTSQAGVIQRSRKPSASGAKNAVSDSAISAEIRCRSASSGQRSRGRTAAGLPAKAREVKASTTK